jgi:two-component system cell cycle response regulator
VNEKEVAVLAQKSSATEFLEAFFRSRRTYKPRFFDSPAPFLRSIKQEPPAAVIAEGAVLRRVSAGIKGIPSVAVIDGAHVKTEIENAIRCQVKNYVCRPYEEKDLEYKLESAILERDAYMKMENTVRDLEAIVDLTQWILATLDPKELLFRMVTKIAEIIPVTRCSVIKVDWIHRSAFVVASFEDPEMTGMRLSLKKYPEIVHALKSREPVVIRNVSTDPLMADVRDSVTALGIRSILVVPIFLRTRVIGTLFVRTSRTDHSFSAQEVRLLKALADASANVLHNAFLFEQIEDEKARLEKLAITDYLTGIFNVRYFYHRIIEEFSRSLRYALPVSCLMVDIDHFKRINDAYGHKTGDLVLKEFASKLKKRSRKSDVVSRYGGEEFVLLLPQTDAAGAVAEAERIREFVKKHRFRSLAGNQRLTVSIGVSTYPHRRIKTHDDLITLADDALFKAKHRGRDKVVPYGR